MYMMIAIALIILASVAGVLVYGFTRYSCKEKKCVQTFFSGNSKTDCEKTCGVVDKTLAYIQRLEKANREREANKAKKYLCSVNNGSRACIESDNGIYNNLGECMTNCVQPTPIITPIITSYPSYYPRYYPSYYPRRPFSRRRRYFPAIPIGGRRR